MTLTPAVQAHGLTKHFGEVVAVDQLSFEAPRGKILGFLGANGAGKSTTLQMLLGLTTPTSGSLKVLGLDLNQNKNKLLKQMNFASAYAHLPGNLSVMQNMLTFARIYQVPNKKKRIQSLLELFEVDHLAKATTGHLSSGEATRVALCKSLLNEPKVLLLDEPTASLDPDIADKVRKRVKQVQQESGMTILYTSHNMLDIEEVCDDVIFMHRGTILARGKPQALLHQFSEDSMEELFIRLARDPNSNRNLGV